MLVASSVLSCSVAADEKESFEALVYESFELDASLITGFTEDTNQAIIRDGDNMLYVNMNPSTKKEIHDFLSSY